MEREQKFYDVNALAEAGKKVWNDALGKIEVQSPDENEKTIFYIGVMSVPSISVKMEDILVHLTGKYMKMVEMHFIRTIGFGIHIGRHILCAY